MQQIAFVVNTREEVHPARDHGNGIVGAPTPFPRYGPNCYAAFLDPHGFMIEIVTHQSPELGGPAG